MWHISAHFSFRCGLATIALLGGCSGQSDADTDSGVQPACASLDEATCANTPTCTWQPHLGGGSCEPALSDAGKGDAVTECTQTNCTPPLCGYVISSGQELCIEKPDCTGLGKATCESTLGCAALTGQALSASSPPISDAYVGCGDGTGTPGAAITCTAQGPEGPCFVRPDTWVPTGWVGWGCVDTMTFEGCMTQAPF